MDGNLRLRHIRVFLEIARSESVSIAADKLNVTQPAVSRALKELEDILGRQLFDRVGRGIRLNEAGRVFQAHASVAMGELSSGRERLGRESGLTTRLSVGVLPTAASDLLPRASLAFLEVFDHVRLRVMTGPNWLLFNQLREGELDLVVGRMPERDAAIGLSFEQLYMEDAVVVARPGHPALGRPVDPTMFLSYPLILPPRGAVIFDAVERYFGSIGLPGMRGAIETVALPVGRKIVALSDALWVISKGVVSDELRSGTLVQIALDSAILSGPVGIGRKRSVPPNAIADVFAEKLRSVAGKQRPG